MPISQYKVLFLLPALSKVFWNLCQYSCYFRPLLEIFRNLRNYLGDSWMCHHRYFVASAIIRSTLESVSLFLVTWRCAIIRTLLFLQEQLGVYANIRSLFVYVFIRNIWNPCHFSGNMWMCHHQGFIVSVIIGSISKFVPFQVTCGCAIIKTSLFLPLLELFRNLCHYLNNTWMCCHREFVFSTFIGSILKFVPLFRQRVDVLPSRLRSFCSQWEYFGDCAIIWAIYESTNIGRLLFISKICHYQVMFRHYQYG